MLDAPKLGFWLNMLQLFFFLCVHGQTYYKLFFFIIDCIMHLLPYIILILILILIHFFNGIGRKENCSFRQYKM